MILSCEIAVKSVIPAIKATLVKEFVETYNLKQNQVAEILGISQSAVSKYTQQVRGRVIRVDNIEEIRPLTNRVINLLVDGIPKGEEFIRLFFQTCTIIRREDLMCEFHQKTDLRIQMKGCSLCPTYILFQNRKEKKKS